MSVAAARAVLLLAGLGLAVAQTPALVVENAWVRATPGSTTAAAYLTLRNPGAGPITIVSVESPVAAHVMIHETTLVAGQSRMRPRARLIIPAGQTLRLAPEGLHVMLADLNRPLAVGQEVPLRIRLADGTSVQVAAVVRPLGVE